MLAATTKIVSTVLRSNSDTVPVTSAQDCAKVAVKNMNNTILLRVGHRPFRPASAAGSMYAFAMAQTSWDVIQPWGAAGCSSGKHTDMCATAATPMLSYQGGTQVPEIPNPNNYNFYYHYY